MKFRVWWTKGNSFQDPENLLLTPNEEVVFCLDGEEIEYVEKREKNQFIVQWFTDVIDAKGNEIYEGDIIHSIIEQCSERGEFEDYTKEEIFEVKFRDGVFGKSNGYYQLMEPLVVANKHWMVKKYEVVGNIFQNPELLK